jgi:RNA polymerase sigma factor (sigma-70 family)
LQSDKKQFRRLKIELDPILAGVLWKRTRDMALVQDIMQETYARLFKALQAGVSIDSIRDYAIGIALNVHKEWLRKRALDLPPAASEHEELREHDEVDGRQDVLATLIAQEELTRLMNVIMRMPRQQRRVVTYLLLYQEKPHEVAARMGIAVGTVQKHAIAAMRRFGRALELAGNRPGLVKLFQKMCRAEKPNDDEE